MPKTPHGETALERHPDVQPEWVAAIVADPYDQWEETDRRTGMSMTLLAGRISGWRYWIKVVLIGGEFETAYSDWRLERKYGGPPWNT